MNMLLSLGIFSLIVSSLLPLLLFFYKSIEGYSDISHLEWEFFSEQAVNELKAAENPAVTGETLSFRNGLGQTVTYQRYNTYVRRQINHTGNEIILQKVQKAEMKASNGLITIRVISKSGKSRSVSVGSLIYGHK
ncbi:hypothetical protein CEF21_15510 [Bacillus sp. FJAT-42376]|nr:hypothetical protein CEF21_15510 [Bacillus sp. FJAT-42376]